MYKLLNCSIKVFLALFLLTTFLPPASHAQSIGISSITQPDGEDSSLGDAEIYAKNNGVSLEESIYRFHIQDIAGELDAKLSENEAETFAGLWVEHFPEFKVVVLFTENGEKIIEPYLTKELIDIIYIQPAKIPLIELQNTQQGILSSLWDIGISVESEINIYENNINLFVAEMDRVRLDNVLHDKLLIIPEYVKIAIISNLGKAEADNIYGGLALNVCNTAFAVEDIYGVLGRGVITAGHCSESHPTMYYKLKALSVQNWLKNGSYDVGFHTTTGLTITNQIQVASTGVFRRVTATKSRDSQVVGEYVCKYAVVTGYTCGYISSKNFSSSGVDSPSPTFIRVNNTAASYPDLSSGGDSGGPWFNNTTAYGVHHGAPGDDPNDAIYMAINYIDGLGVSVVLNPVFADVPWTHTAWQDIERLYNSGVTGGCSTNPLNYCPNNTITRAEMAVFLLRGMHGSSYNPPPVGGSTGFNDVPTSHWAAAWIKQFAAEGITGGCGSGNYCPEATTTNAQMSIFLLRSKYGSGYNPPAVGASTGFNDVSTIYWAAAWIKQLKAESITTGCGGGNYCPESNVTRAKMAGLLVRTFNLP